MKFEPCSSNWFPTPIIVSSKFKNKSVWKGQLKNEKQVKIAVLEEIGKSSQEIDKSIRHSLIDGRPSELWPDESFTFDEEHRKILIISCWDLEQV